jgi:hypothetical protein
MNQIMRLRRRAGGDHHIEDRNNGYRHEKAFVKNIYKNGLLHEADLLPDSYGGKFHPRAVPELLSSLPAITKALLRRKVTPAKALLHQHKDDLKDVQRIFEKVDGPTSATSSTCTSRLRRGRHGRRRRDANEMAATGAGDGAASSAEQGTPGLERRGLPHPMTRSPTGPAASAAASPPSCTARWRRSRRCSTSSSSSSTARPAAAPASSPSTRRSSPTRSTPAPSRSPSRPTR